MIFFQDIFGFEFVFGLLKNRCKNYLHDPTIKIGAVLFPHDGVYNDWSKDVLQKVQNTADFLIIHDYFRRKPNPNNVTYQEMLNSIVLLT